MSSLPIILREYANEKKNLSLHLTLIHQCMSFMSKLKHLNQFGCQIFFKASKKMEELSSSRNVFVIIAHFLIYHSNILYRIKSPTFHKFNNHMKCVRHKVIIFIFSIILKLNGFKCIHFICFTSNHFKL